MTHCKKHILWFTEGCESVYLDSVLYFSDVAASQHMNRKNSTNLESHASKFGITAQWYFFTISHGNNPRDAVGGTTK
jgi:hypothetical protein